MDYHFFISQSTTFAAIGEVKEELVSEKQLVRIKLTA